MKKTRSELEFPSFNFNEPREIGSLSECLQSAYIELRLCYLKLQHLKSTGHNRKTSSDFLFFLRKRSSIEATIFSIEEALGLLNSNQESANH